MHTHHNCAERSWVIFMRFEAFYAGCGHESIHVAPTETLSLRLMRLLMHKCRIVGRK